jgi:hypothetical protein
VGMVQRVLILIALAALVMSILAGVLGVFSMATGQLPVSAGFAVVAIWCAWIAARASERPRRVT